MKTGLISIDEKLSNWFYSQINSEQDPESSFAKDLTRAVSKCALFALVSVRNYFFVPLSRELPYPWAFVVGNMATVTSFECWAGNDLIDDAFPKKTNLSTIFPKQEMSFWQKAANVGNVVVSLISQLPGVYPAMQYNKANSIPAGLIVGLGGAIFPMRSTQVAIQRYFDRRGADSSKQDAFVQLLRDNQQRFIAKTPEEKRIFIDALTRIQEKGNTPEQIQEYLGHLLSVTEPVEDKLSSVSYLSTQAARATGLALTCIYQYVIGVYTFAKTKEHIWNNDAFAGTMAGAAVLSELYLTVVCMVNTAGSFWQTITGINKDSVSQATLPGKLRPKTTTFLQSVGVGMNLLSLGVSYVIWRDFFKNPEERTFFETTMCGAVFLLFQAAIPYVINGSMEYVLSSYGSKDEKEAIAISKKYQYLADSIERLSPQDFNTYFLSLFPNKNLPLFKGNIEGKNDIESGLSSEESLSLLHGNIVQQSDFNARLARVTEDSDEDFFG